MKKFIFVLCLFFGLFCNFAASADSKLPSRPTADFWENELPFNKLIDYYEFSHGVRGVGLVSQDIVIVPKCFSRPLTEDAAEPKKTYYVAQMSHDTRFVDYGCPYEVEIKSLSVPRTISHTFKDRVSYNLTGQSLCGLEDLYIPSTYWLFKANFCFVGIIIDEEDTYDGFTIWTGEYGSDDVYPVTEMALPWFYDGKEYRFESIKGLKTIDLSQLMDVSKIQITRCGDLEEVILNPAAEAPPVIKDCDALTKLSMPKSIVEIPAETCMTYIYDDPKLPTALKKVVGSPRATQYGGGPTEIVMPDNLEVLCGNAFGNNLEHAVVGQRVRELSGVFSKCEYLKDVVIGSRVATIEAGEFKQSTVLQTVESLNPEPPQSTGDIFDAVTYLYATLYVPIGSKEKYEKATGWRKFAKIEEKEYPAPSPIDRLTKTALHTYPGEKVVIEVELDEGTTPVLTYRVEDESVAAVAADGTVRGLTAGQTVVSVIPDGKEELAAKCVVTVMEKPVAVESIEANPMSIRMFDECPIEYTVYPENATKKDIEWSSSNQDVAYVTCDGYIIGIGKGDAIIYGKPMDGSGTTVEIPVTVDYALSVEQPNAHPGSVNVKADGLNVIVNGLSDSDVVKLFSIDGMKVADVAADAQGSVTVTAPSAGIYIVKAGSRVRKVYLQ